MIKDNVIVNFIPVLANPYKHDPSSQILREKCVEKDNQIYIRRPYYEGLYVTRIIVKPKDYSKIYFWKSNG